MNRIATRLISAAALVALLGLAIPGSAGAAGAHPSGAVFNKWGWVTVRNTAVGTYTPAAADRGNSAGKVNVVKQTSTGHYTIVMKGIRDDGGVPHVSTLGSTVRICSILGWGSGTGTNEEVYVSCYTSLGVPASTRFSVSYLATNRQEGSSAYLWSTGTSGDANAQYTFNSKGMVNSINRTDVGKYLVVLGGLGAAHGNVQVSAFLGLGTNASANAGTTPAGANPVTCNATSWSRALANMRVYVSCRESHGLFTDSGFNLTFTDHQGLKGLAHGKVAYLWSNQATNASFTPNASYRYSSAGATPHVTRQGIGRYTAMLPGMPTGGAALVNAYGSSARRCQVGAIRTSGTPQLVKVRCFTFSGNPVDAKFTLSYEH
jgi:hypothetical protein